MKTAVLVNDHASGNPGMMPSGLALSLPKLLAAIFVTLIFYHTAFAAEPILPAGKWLFEEHWQGPGDAFGFIKYELVVSSNMTGLVNLDGHMTLERLSVLLKEHDDRVDVILVNELEKGLFPGFSTGDLLFQLERGEHSTFITHWKKIQPELPANLQPGIYFMPAGDK